MLKYTLKPCPFCGGEAKLVSRLNPRALDYGTNRQATHEVRCGQCGVRTLTYDWFKRKAVEAWNRRELVG